MNERRAERLPQFVESCTPNMFGNDRYTDPRPLRTQSWRTIMKRKQLRLLGEANYNGCADPVVEAELACKGSQDGTSSPTGLGSVLGRGRNE